jgi:hypothetical protein
VGAHSQKTTVNVWRWDKKEPVLRFPIKEEIQVLKVASQLCVAGTKSGKIMVWNNSTG